MARAKKRKKSASKKRKGGKKRKYVFTKKRKAALKKAQAANRHKFGSKKKRSGGKKKSRKGGKRGKNAYARAKAAEARTRHAAERKAMVDALVAKGKGRAVAELVVARALRVKHGKGKKKSAFFEKLRAQEAAERAAAYIAANYGKHVSYS